MRKAQKERRSRFGSIVPSRRTSSDSAGTYPLFTKEASAALTAAWPRESMNEVVSPKPCWMLFGLPTPFRPSVETMAAPPSSHVQHCTGSFECIAPCSQPQISFIAIFVVATFLRATSCTRLVVGKFRLLAEPTWFAPARMYESMSPEVWNLKF